MALVIGRATQSPGYRLRPDLLPRINQYGEMTAEREGDAGRRWAAARPLRGVTLPCCESDPSTASRESLIREHMPLAARIVSDTLLRVPAHVRRDDLLSAAYTALVTAARAFDPGRGIPFGSFAAARVRGALLDEMRAMDWATRTVRSRARAVEQTREVLTGEAGGSPTDGQVAERLGMPVSQVTGVAGKVAQAVVLSLHGFQVQSAEDLVVDRALGPEELLLHREQIGYLHDAVAALPERQHLAVKAFYLQERPIADVAAMLSVSESRAWQIVREGLVLVREAMLRAFDPDAAAGRDDPGHGEIVARRRAAYCVKVSARGSLRSRLAVTTVEGMPAAA